MLYIFLLHSDPDLPMPVDVIDQHFAVADRARQLDAYIMSEALGAAASARTVRLRDGQATITDGPFAETKEALGGLYILDCKDLEEALDYAKRIPDAQFGSVEVRPLAGAPDWEYAVASDRHRVPMNV